MAQANLVRANVPIAILSLLSSQISFKVKQIFYRIVALAWTLNSIFRKDEDIDMDGPFAIAFSGPFLLWGVHKLRKLCYPLRKTRKFQ